MENILILDTETTGLDAKKGKVIEIAGILYNIPTRSILSQVSTLCYAEENPALEINGIEVATLKKIPGEIQDLGIRMLHEMIVKSNAIVAHNAEFDKRWVATIPVVQEAAQYRKWICTRNDVIWPIRKGVSLNLISICASLGVPIINAHRALQDCLLLLGALECIEDIESFLDKSGKGRVIYRAKVTFENRQIVKDAGFLWDNINKVWFAKITPEHAAVLPFMVYPAENP